MHIPEDYSRAFPYYVDYLRGEGLYFTRPNPVCVHTGLIDDYDLYFSFEKIGLKEV